jgi:hypothetical protein
MMELAKDMPDDDTSLLHPLFARLPPLFPDTPDAPHAPPQPSISANTEYEAPEGPNPYRPIPLSRLFILADILMREIPWDGDVVRGREVMGEASVVCSYTSETNGLDEAVSYINGEVVKPGAMDQEAPLPPPVRTSSRSLKIVRYLSAGMGVLALGLSVRTARLSTRSAFTIGAVLLGGLALSSRRRRVERRPDNVMDKFDIDRGESRTQALAYAKTRVYS